VIAAFNQRDAGIATMAPVQSRGLVVGVFNSSQIQKFGDTLPIGVIAVTAQRAMRREAKRHFSSTSASVHSYRSRAGFSLTSTRQGTA